MSIIKGWMESLLDLLGVSSGTHTWMDNLIIIVIIIAISFLTDFICRKIILRIFKKMSERTKNTWDDMIINRKIIHKAVNFVPAILIYLLIPLAFHDNNNAETFDFIRRICQIYILAVVLRFINASLNLVNDFSAQKEGLRDKPIKGFVQILQVIVIVIGVICIIAILIKQSPVRLLAGLGASAAILTLVFKDTILGFVSGIQLSTNNMLRPGDWVTVPKYGADGTVLEVTLYAVRIQNWDNTVTTVPPSALIGDSFQNWTPMFESGGRRIKRSIHIDMNSVRFCTPEMLEKFRKISCLSEYINLKEKELNVYNQEHPVDTTISVNGRRQTNLGVFRAYLASYLKKHPMINQELTCMVRHLQPTDKGIPVEIYCFSTDRSWVNYESIQADIFDHILAVVPEFDLRVFQDISGADIRMIKEL